MKPAAHLLRGGLLNPNLSLTNFILPEEVIETNFPELNLSLAKSYFCRGTLIIALEEKKSYNLKSSSANSRWISALEVIESSTSSPIQRRLPRRALDNLAIYGRGCFTLKDFDPNACTMEIESALEQGPSESESFSLSDLIKVLLAPKTLPHLFLLIILCSFFFMYNEQGNTDASARLFIASGLGYLATAMFAHSTLVQKWTALPMLSEKSDRHILVRMLFSFRITWFPMLMVLLFYILMAQLFNEGGALENAGEFISLGLASLFVFWSIMQAMSFRATSATMILATCPDSKKQDGSYVSTLIFQVITVQILAYLMLWLFVSFQEGGYSAQQTLKDHWLFILIAISVQSSILFWLRKEREMAANNLRMRKFWNRWGILIQIFVLWHLLAIYRHWFIKPGDTMIVFEETILMVVTVLMAIWALTSKGVGGEESRWFGSHNALFIGVAFGFAYAGSVAMLTQVFDDVTTVMLFGHLVTAATAVWLMGRTLGIQTIIIDSEAKEDEVEQSVHEIVQEEFAQQEIVQEEVVEEQQSESEDHSDDEVNWTGEPEDIGSGSEWLDDDDDEVELLD